MKPIKENIISELRHAARKLIRELGVLKLNIPRNRAPQHWHTLIEIANEPNITISKLGHVLLLSSSSTSRIVKSLMKDGLVLSKDGLDKREKYLQITAKGLHEIKHIDEFSHLKIKGALEFLSEEDQNQIIDAMKKYSNALEKSRTSQEEIKIHTLSTSRTLRKQIIHMIETIQKHEFSLPITNEINACILKAENNFYFNKSYNFWYAINKDGAIIGSIGLKKINNDSAEIKKLFVNKKYRGKGVSRKLLNSLVKAASKHQFKYLYLGTVDILHAAQRFYEKHRFLRIAEEDLPLEFSKCSLDKIFYKVKIKDLKDSLSSQME